MILLVHMLFGAAIGSSINNPYAAIILAFLSHYFLDLLPHIEYNIDNLWKKQWSKAGLDFLKVVFDFLLGVLLVSMFSGGRPIIYVFALMAILPDCLSALSGIFPNKILDAHNRMHIGKIHFLKDNPSAGSGQIKISNFWRILSQVAVVIISISLLKY